jgi:DUF4097 and DUF4098 domain-containing protein YvlB
VLGSNGDVSVAQVKGSVLVKSSFGLVQAADVGPLTFDGANAAVRATSVRGDAAVRTSSAAVVLSGVEGSVNVTNDGGAVEVFAAAPRVPGTCRRIALTTSFAPIRVVLPPGVGFDVNARTSLGKVRSELPLAAGGAASSLVGPVAGGGCEVTLANRNGDISLVPGGAAVRSPAAAPPRPTP